MTIESQDNKTDCYCTCHYVGLGRKECGDCCKNKTTGCCPKCYGRMGTLAGGGIYCHDSRCPCHSPATDDMVEEWQTTFLNAGTELLGVDCSALIGVVSRIISRTREENPKLKEFYEQVARAEKKGREEAEKKYKEIIELHSMELKRAWEHGRAEFAKALLKTLYERQMDFFSTESAYKEFVKFIEELKGL